MRAILEYNNGATQAQILQGLVDVLTGETNVNNLTGFNAANSSIVATVPAGWTVHDSTSGTNKQVIKAAYSGNASIYKYAEISIDSTTLFTMFLYEDFNATTHIGTNITNNATNYRQRLSLSAAGNKIHVFASARFIILLSEVAGSYGDSSGNGATVLAEMTPIIEWNNSTSYPYPSACLILSYCFQNATNKYCYMSRAKNNVDSDATGGNATFGIGSLCFINTFTNSTYFPTGVGAVIYDGSSNQKVPRFPMFPVNPATFTMPIGDISASSDIWLLPTNLLGNFDAVTIGSTQYVAVPAYSTTTKYLVRDG